MSGALRSGQVAAAAGVNLQTLRHYERRGLLAEPGRSLGGHRLYPPEAVTMLRAIKAAQRLGFTLDEVAELLTAGWHGYGVGPHGQGAGRHGQGAGRHGHGAGRHGHGAGRDRGLQARAAAKLAEVDAKIADLRVIRATLVAAVDAGCDDLVACAASPCCPLPFSELAEEGTQA